MTTALALIILVGVGAGIWVAVQARRRNVQLWLPAWARGDWAGARERRACPRKREGDRHPRSMRCGRASPHAPWAVNRVKG